MPLEFRKDRGRLVWIRNPFTGTVTYFTDVHRKRSGFRSPPRGHSAREGESAPDPPVLSARDLEAAQAECPFCPGNEQMTPGELLRVAPADVPGSAPTRSPWLIRAFHNLIPRIPECCTGGRNESYVVVEDPRHFVDGARQPDDLLHTGMLPPSQVAAILRANVEVARLSYANPAVEAVLIRKNQGRQSGASQPHIHNQVIGSDQPFQPILQESERLVDEPGLWREVLSFVDGEGLVIARRGACVLYFCPFGAFPRSYEIICQDLWARITDVAPSGIEDFAFLLHQALRILDPLPLDYEIHDGPTVPLHAHVSARHFPYSNIGGTLNLPATLIQAVASKPSGASR